MEGIRNIDDVRRIIGERNPDGGIVTPDFSTAEARAVDAAWGGKSVEARFSDPLLAGWSVLIVADTLPTGYDESVEYGDKHGIVPERITTMVMRFPRYVLPELNTHRVFSRNSASSRARSFKTTLRPVMEDAFIPLFTENKKGMGGDYVDAGTFIKAASIWLDARDEAVRHTLELLTGPTQASHADYRDISDGWEEIIDRYTDAYKSGDTDELLSIHKQNANRLLEPFMWHEALVTSTYWKNFLDLRISPYAQPEIHALAVLVKTALEFSRPERSWIHIPFGDKETLDTSSWESLEPGLLSAASECARISYKDRSGMENRSNGDELGRKLLAQRHMSPFEHIAFDTETTVSQCQGLVDRIEELAGQDILDSNLSPSWIQYRRLESAKEQ